jgi:hypothetical protein
MSLGQTPASWPYMCPLMLKALGQKAFIARPRPTAGLRTKSIGITPMGLQALRQAMPVAIRIQRDMFGEDGAHGGALLAKLQQVETHTDLTQIDNSNESKL